MVCLPVEHLLPVASLKVVLLDHFYLFFVKYMPEVVAIMIKMFADDTKIFTECKRNEDRI